MMLKIKCPECAIEGSISLVESSYEGPYRCWKCKGLFTIKIEGNQLNSCEPLSQEEFDKQQQIKSMQDKFKKHG